jgi:hypothetical protein
MRHYRVNVVIQRRWQEMQKAKGRGESKKERKKEKASHINDESHTTVNE